MFWQEDESSNLVVSPEDVLDLIFNIECKQLPVDHAHALSEAIKAKLPWLEQEPLAAIHPIHVAGSQNGWIRADHSPDELIHLSKRTKFTLRIPKERKADAKQLTGKTLDIAGNCLKIGQPKEKPLSTMGTIFSRFIVCKADESEEEFLHRMVEELGQMGVRIRKALCGTETELHTPEGPLLTRSLMLADLPTEESIRLQQQGIGEHRLMGCGIFIPHKGIEAIKKTTDDENQ